MWDLRYATAPMRVLDQHKRGILSVAWCRQDSDLLLSAAKDNRVLCWNPNSETPGGEVGSIWSNITCVHIRRSIMLYDIIMTDMYVHVLQHV